MAADFTGTTGFQEIPLVPGAEAVLSAGTVPTRTPEKDDATIAATATKSAVLLMFISPPPVSRDDRYSKIIISLWLKAKSS
jgi:hypothetical protein